MGCKTEIQVILAQSAEESIAEVGKTTTADFTERFIKNAIFIL